MQGIIFVLFDKFVREKYNYNKLKEIKENADLEDNFHSVGKVHPDEDLFKLVGSTCNILKLQVDELLASFGKYIGPELIKTYSAYINSEWDSLDLLENIEQTMHSVVRMNSPEAEPPNLVIKRNSDNEVIINYTSERKIISLGIGIIEAIGEHYSEGLEVTQTEIPNGVSLLITKI